MKRSILLAALLLSLLFSPSVQGAESSVEYRLSAPEKIDPALPNVLLLGDSISMGYAPVVREKLEGKANVYRVLGSEAATVRRTGTLRLDTDAALQHLDDWLGGMTWSVIHFNWGLHDVKIRASGEHQVQIAEYERNLRQLVQRLKNTHARLIWASTTPVPEGTEHGAIARKAEDEVAYNAVAKQVMEESGIPIDDLHALAFSRLSELQRPANVHFTSTGSTVLGAQVVDCLKKALNPKYEN